MRFVVISGYHKGKSRRRLQVIEVCLLDERMICDSEGVKAKVCLIGERFVGKSALVRRFVLDQFSDEYFATLGMKVYKKVAYVVSPGSDTVVPVTMMIWDVMGDDRTDEQMRRIYLHGVSGVMAVADVTKPDTVYPLSKKSHPALCLPGNVPVQFMLNKWDAGENQYARDAGRHIARQHVAPCYLTSALRGDNVERAFNELAQRILACTRPEFRRMPDQRALEVLADSVGTEWSLRDLSNGLGIDSIQTELYARELVRSGRLVLNDVDMAPDGSPIMRFSPCDRLLVATS